MSTVKVFCSVVAMTLASLSTEAAIYPMTGTMKHTVPTDISLGGLALSLVYDTTIKAQGNALGYGFTVPLNSFGSMWSTSFHHQLQVDGNRMTAILSLGDGQVLNFVGNSAVFHAPLGNPHKLDLLYSVVGCCFIVVDGYRFTNAFDGTVENYDPNGLLLKRTDASGLVLTFSYSNSNLTHVSASDGRSVRFTYNNNLISQITGSDGRSINATYDANANLTSLIWQDGKTRQFLYELGTPPAGVTPLVWAMTGETDEKNVRAATWGYDASGRATSSELAGGVGKYSVTYGLPPEYYWTDVYDPNRDVIYRRLSQKPPTETVVTLPNGQSIGMTANLSNSAIVLSGKSQPAGSGCAASTSAIAYDTNGNITSKDDFNGTRSCFANDLSRNLPVVSVTGLPNTTDCTSVLPSNAPLPVNSRKASTQYHPDLALATKTATPLAITSNIYNGQADPFNGNAIANCAPTAAPLPNGKPIVVLCKQVTQDTTDADGHLGLAAAIDTTVPVQTSSFTYDGFGRMLSSTDSLNKTTSYAYYSDTVYSGSVPGTFDPNFNNVALLLHADGIDGSTNFIDSSSIQHTVTAVGSAATSIVNPKFGVGSLRISSLSSAVNADASGIDLSAAYTIEGWVNISSPFSGDYSTLIATNGNTYPSRWVIDLGASGSTLVVRVATPNNSIVWESSAAPYTLGTWAHVAVVNDTNSNTFKVFVNGTLMGSRAAVSLPAAAKFEIGKNSSSWSSSPYSIDEFRVTTGVVRYASNFTPATTAFLNNGLIVDPTSVGHRVGDLQTITNPAGQVTQFTKYDPSGRLLESIDSKGIVTTNTYTPRGWLSSTTVTPPAGAARLTNYTYDAVGQLTAVSTPDGQTVGYTYDAAHRLVGASDTKGNSVVYTLDNMGNRVGEQVKDPQGTLQRSMTRAFDALNRVQQITGQ